MDDKRLVLHFFVGLQICVFDSSLGSIAKSVLIRTSDFRKGIEMSSFEHSMSHLAIGMSYAAGILSSNAGFTGSLRPRNADATVLLPPVSFAAGAAGSPTGSMLKVKRRGKFKRSSRVRQGR
jgi:hypothetical protein